MIKYQNGCLYFQNSYCGSISNKHDEIISFDMLLNNLGRWRYSYEIETMSIFDSHGTKILSGLPREIANRLLNANYKFMRDVHKILNLKEEIK